MDQITKENTLLIFIGDNGTDNDILRGYSESHGKGTLCEGGLESLSLFRDLLSVAKMQQIQA